MPYSIIRSLQTNTEIYLRNVNEFWKTKFLQENKLTETSLQKEKFPHVMPKEMCKCILIAILSA
jgi:hypothetical protein